MTEAFGIFHNNNCLLDLVLRMVWNQALSMRYCYVIILMRLVQGLSQAIYLIVETLINLCYKLFSASNPLQISIDENYPRETTI